MITQKILLLIMVSSVPEEIDRRNFIRKTWGRSVEGIDRVSVKFFICFNNSETKYYQSDKSIPDDENGDVILDSVEKERDTFNDIVVCSNFTESYKKLSEKTYKMLQWAVQYMKLEQMYIPFLGKADTDTRYFVIIC